MKIFYLHKRNSNIEYMNIEYLQKAISILVELGEKDLADEVRNITYLFLYTEDDKMDEDYETEEDCSDSDMESE